jgi:hypothetical protein
MQTRLRVKRYHQNKKMQPLIHIAGTPFGDLTNIQMSGIIYCFLVLFNKLFHGHPLSFWIVLCFLDDVADKSKIYKEPSDGVIQTPSDYQAVHEKTRQQTRLRVQRCWQNKDVSSSVRKSQTPFIDVSNTQQSGTILFHYSSYSLQLGFMFSSFNSLVYL